MNKPFFIDMLTVNRNDKAGGSSEDSGVFVEGEVKGAVGEGAVGEGAVEEGKDAAVGEGAVEEGKDCAVGKGAKMEVDGRQRKRGFEPGDAKSASNSLAVREDGGKSLGSESSAMQEDVSESRRTKTG